MEAKLSTLIIWRMVHSRLVALNSAGKGEPPSKHLGLMKQLGYECVQNGAWAVVYFFKVYFGYSGKMNAS